MKMRLPFSIFFFIAFFCFRFLNIAQDIHFNLVTRPPEDIGSQIAGMTQDAQGFLWFGTQNGLYKYDGYQYTSYHSEPLNPNSPAGDNIYDVFADKAGYIWIAISQSGVDRLDPATGIFTHFRHNNNDPGSLVNDSALIIRQDHEGVIWIGTVGGLDRFDSKTNKFFHYTNNANDPSSISCNVIMTIYEDRQGTIWVGTGTPFFGYGNCGGLNKLNKKTGKFTRYLHDDKDPHSLVDNRVVAIFEDSRGNFWVGTAGDGLHTMDRAKGTFERHLHDPSHPDKLSRPPVKKKYSYADDHISFIIEDNKGRIWIGTFEGGLNVYDPSTQKVSYYGAGKNSKKNVGDNDFWAAYKTRDNVIWISTYGENVGNLYKIIPSQNILPYTRIGKIVRSFAEDDAHTLWMGTTNGLIHKDRNGKEQQFLIDKDSSSSSNPIDYYIEKDNNKFWLTTSHGLYLFDPVTKIFSAYHHQPGNVNSLLSDTVIMLKKSTGNKLWIGGINGLDLMDTKSNTFTHFQNNPKDTTTLSDNVVIAINIDKKQNVWVGTGKGLNRLDKKTGRFKRYLNQFTIVRIIEDSKGDIWCSSPNDGLFKYDKESDNFLSFTDETDIITTSLRVFGITEDHEQNLWLTTPKGLISLNKERNTAVLYGKNQGVNGLALTTFSYTLQNGEIVCGDTSGYFQFMPGLLQRNISPPSVAISNFLLNNVPVQPVAKGILSAPLIQTKEIRLNHNQNTFSFEFANIDFISEHANAHLLYTLQNYDNAWRKAHDERTAYYFNLPPGNYIFKVKAINAAGVAAEKDITIIIAPPWWRTWWAYALYAICFLAIAFFANRFIRNRIIEKERMKSREKELEQAKEIEKAYNELKSTQAQLVQSEKMASLGELTAGIAHEIQNPLNFVNNFSEVNTELINELKEEQKKEARDLKKENEIINNIKENEQKINHHGKRADAIVKSMLQHSKQTKGVKELTDINALVDEYLRLSYHGMRAKGKDFNADFKTDFDESIGQINVVGQDIGRVLLNLFNNAFYAVNEKRKTAHENYKPLVTVRTLKTPSPGGRGAEIIISDNGNGIPQNTVDKIFQPFFTTKPTGEGTGLGLSLSYDIIKAHGGKIKVETKEGEGAEFIIYLPLI